MDDLQERLAEPFSASEVKWKPQTVKDARAMVVAYVDARVVMDRLDDVLGTACWQDQYTVLADGAVSCRLRVKLGDEWITKEDVGSESEQPDEGDRRKAAYSDALKRAAVKFGIGRYLYRLPKQWVDYDPQKKQLKQTPALPEWARPKSEQAKQPPEAKSPAASKSSPEPKATAADRHPARASRNSSLSERVTAFEALLMGQKLCKENELWLKVMETYGHQYEGDLDDWPEEAIAEVRALCKEFESERRACAQAMR